MWQKNMICEIAEKRKLMGETRHSLSTPLKIPADTEVAEVICLDSRHII